MIRVTKVHAEADDTLERIIKDADSAHLAKKSFSDISDLLKEELNLICNKNIKLKKNKNTRIKFLTVGSIKISIWDW